MKNILQDFIVKKKEGFYCTYGDFYIDPMYPVETALVSHGHGDHATPGHQNIYCTEETAAIMQLRYGTRRNEKFVCYSYKEVFRIKNIEIQLFSAGHILGSAQILMKYEGVSYLYSGDIKAQEDPTCHPIEYVESDVLITETTFAHPNFSHPNPIEEVEKLKNISTNIMLGAYALGKAQRLTYLLDKYLPEKNIFVHHSMHGLHHLYERYGFSLGKYQLYNRKVMKERSENTVFLLPPTTFRAYSRAKGVLRVFATGWKNSNHADLLLSISDHVDWNDLLFYIEKVKPAEIWTVHGDASYLKSFYANRIPIRELVHTWN